MIADTRVMPVVLGLLIIVLATLVLLLRASALVSEVRQPTPVAWLSRAVDDDRDRGLALAGATAELR